MKKRVNTKRIFLLSFALGTSMIFLELYLTNQQLKGLYVKQSQVNKEYSLLKEKTKNYEKEINLLQEAEYLGELARKEYFLSAVDEVVFVLPEKKKKTKILK